MGEDFQDLLNAVEKKRAQLYKVALSMDLTSEEVLSFSCELDKLINEVYIFNSREQDENMFKNK